MAFESEEGQTKTQTQSFGGCSFGGCDCQQYVAPTSKWSKDKCKTCDHWKNKHLTCSIHIKKENVAVAIQPHSESFLQSHKFTITDGGKTLSFVGHHFHGGTAYGSHFISHDDNRQFMWTFHVIKMGFNSANISIGIGDARMQFEKDGYGFGYKGGYCLCDTGVAKSTGKYTPTGAPFVEKDFITMKLNMAKRQLIFAVNGKEVRPFKSIISNAQTKYRMAVAMESKSTITVTDFIMDEATDAEVKSSDNKAISVEGFGDHHDDAKQSQDDIVRKLTQTIVSLKQENVKLRQRINELESEKKENEMELKAKDSNGFEQWNEEHVLHWMLSIESGALIKYKQKLDQNIRKLQIKGNDLLQMDRLDIEQLGVTKFSDQKVMQKHIEKLRGIGNDCKASGVTYM